MQFPNDYASFVPFRLRKVSVVKSHLDFHDLALAREGTMRAKRKAALQTENGLVNYRAPHVGGYPLYDYAHPLLIISAGFGVFPTPWWHRHLPSISTAASDARSQSASSILASVTRSNVQCIIFIGSSSAFLCSSIMAIIA